MKTVGKQDIVNLLAEVFFFSFFFSFFFCLVVV